MKGPVAITNVEQLIFPDRDPEDGRNVE